MWIALIPLFLIPFTAPAIAQSCYQWGNQTTCDNGVTVNHYGNGNSTVGGRSAASSGPNVSRGSTGIGSTGDGIFAGARSGLTYRVQGNTVYFSDGTTATLQGDTTTFSDGRTCRRYGNSSVCN